MQNWKTTIGGLVTAVLLCVITAISKGTVDISTLIGAAGIAAVGVLAQDAKTLPIFQTPIVKEALPLMDTAIGLADAAHPTNVLLTDIKTGIDALNGAVNQTAAPVPNQANTKA